MSRKERQPARPDSAKRPRIGVSANYMAPVRDRRFYIGKALHYAEEQLLDLVWRHGGLPIIVPLVGGDEGLEAVAGELDGLLLSGGEDVSPTLYGEVARRPEWAGNAVRDHFELGLLRSCLHQEKPILGVCRGMQLINVAHGGSLHQDVMEDGVVTRAHRDAVVYDALEHHVFLKNPGYLHDLYGAEEGRVNTVHHQAVRRLGAGLEVLAESDDGLVEALRVQEARFALGVQWHPEWLDPGRSEEGFLDAEPLLEAFMGQARGHRR